MSFINPLTPKTTNTSCEQQSLGARLKNGCANIGNRIRQKYQHSTLLVALRKLSEGKNSSCSLGKSGKTATPWEFVHNVREELKRDLEFQISAKLTTMQEKGVLSVETCPLDELEELVTFTQHRIAKGKNDLCNEVTTVREYATKFIKDLESESLSDNYSSEQLQTDLQKLAIIKKICPQETKGCIRTLNNNHALRTLDNEIQERMKSLTNNNGFVDLSAVSTSELQKLVALAKLREKKGREGDSNAVQELKECFLKFINNLSKRMISHTTKDERSQLAVIKKLCPKEVGKFMERVQKHKGTEEAKTLDRLLNNENTLW